MVDTDPLIYLVRNRIFEKLLHLKSKLAFLSWVEKLFVFPQCILLLLSCQANKVLTLPGVKTSLGSSMVQ